MEEVEGFLAGELDYTKIKGNTGPLGTIETNVCLSFPTPSG